MVIVDLTTLPSCMKSQVEQVPHFLIPLHSRFGLAFGSRGGGTLALMSFSRSDWGSGQLLENLFYPRVTLHRIYIRIVKFNIDLPNIDSNSKLALYTVLRISESIFGESIFGKSIFGKSIFGESIFGESTGCPQKNVHLFWRAVAPSKLGLFLDVRGVSEWCWPKLSNEY